MKEVITENTSSSEVGCTKDGSDVTLVIFTCVRMEGDGLGELNIEYLE